MGICSLLIAIILYLTETLYFRAATLNFYVVFPCILNGKITNLALSYFNIVLITALTLGGLIYLPRYLKLWDMTLEMDDENVQLLKQAGAVKRRRNVRKNN